MKRFMITSLLLSTFSLTPVHAGIVADFLKVLPAGTHLGQNCKVVIETGEVTHSQYFYISFYSASHQRLVSHHFSEFMPPEVTLSEFYEDSLKLAYTQHPDDGYTGKDVVAIEVLEGKVSMKVKDYGPLGILSETTKAKCQLN